MHLDLSSIQLLGYSFKPTLQILDGGIAKFTFANINLPDSNANEPASHGYAQFRIKLKKNLPLGTTIYNTAFIYFDFNSPVVTNTTTNILKYHLGVASQTNNYKVDFVMYPNPTIGLCTIELPKSERRYSASLLNVVGVETKKLFEDKTFTSYSFNTSVLSKGIYFQKTNFKRVLAMAFCQQSFERNTNYFDLG